MVVAGTQPIDQSSEAETLAGLLDVEVTTKPSSLLTALGEAVYSGLVRALLSRLLDASHRDAVSVAGYVHPNGFSKIRLATRPGTWTLRLHIWNQPGAEAQIHSHQWNFASMLLAGTMKTRIYDAIDDPVGTHVRWRCWRTKANHYKFEPTSPCALSLERELDYQGGDAYEQDHRLLHTLETVPRPTLATLVLQSHDVSGWSVVVTERGERLPHELPVQQLGRAQIEEALTLARALLPV